MDFDENQKFSLKCGRWTLTQTPLVNICELSDMWLKTQSFNQFGWYGTQYPVHERTFRLCFPPGRGTPCWFTETSRFLFTFSLYILCFSICTYIVCVCIYEYATFGSCSLIVCIYVMCKWCLDSRGLFGRLYGRGNWDLQYPLYIKYTSVKKIPPLL